MNNKNGNGRSLPLLIIAALGVVFGDIGTSPLYALKLSVEATQGSGASITSSVLGVLSLITWALIIVVSIKYILIIMRADNHGEGGVFALTALLLRKIEKKSKTSKARWFVIVLGTLGAALFFGDSLIINWELFSIDLVSVELYDFNKSVLCKKKLSNSKIIQSPCFCEV